MVITNCSLDTFYFDNLTAYPLMFNFPFVKPSLLIVAPVSWIIGFLSNIVTAKTFTKMQLDGKMKKLFTLSAVFDIMINNSLLPIMYLARYPTHTNIFLVFYTSKVFFLFNACLTQITLTITLIITTLRLISVYYPHRYKSYNSTKGIYIIIVIFFIVHGLMSIHLTEWIKVEVACYMGEKIYIFILNVEAVFSFWSQLLVVGTQVIFILIPLLVSLIMNILIITKHNQIKMKKRKLKGVLNQQINYKANEGPSMIILLNGMLGLQTIAFFMMYLAEAIGLLILKLSRSFNSTVSYFVGGFIMFYQVEYFAVNIPFFVYFFTNKEFRKESIKLFDVFYRYIRVC